jgi:hypothetical protein
MEAPLYVFNGLMLEKSPEIFNFLIKVLTFLMSFKSTLYSFYFQKLCRIYTEKFFQSDNTYTKTPCFYTYVTKRLGSVIKKSVQGESSWSMFWCISVYGVHSFTCDSQLLTSFNNYSQVSTKIYNTCGLLWILVITCEYLWNLWNYTCKLRTP